MGKELTKGKDELWDWARERFGHAFVSTDERDVIEVYGDIMERARTRVDAFLRTRGRSHRIAYCAGATSVLAIIVPGIRLNSVTTLIAPMWPYYAATGFLLGTAFPWTTLA